MPYRILIVEDNQNLGETLELDLQLHGYDPLWRDSAESALVACQHEEFDVVLTDLRLPGMSGLELCERLTSNRPDIPVVVITAFGSLEIAIAAMRVGAYDFVTKPVEMETLHISLQRATQHRVLQAQITRLNEALRQKQPFDLLIGDSPPMQDLCAQLERLAASDASVFLLGESGSGKDLAAQMLHQRGPRARGPFVAVNCAALPAMLLESELFGHVRGAFTDAHTARTGLFKQADGGILFLDEIGDCPLDLQVKLLRALEESRVRPLGSSTDIAFDVRLITATHRNLEAEIEAGRFREDLFYRLCVIPLEMPPLRTRGTDILLLAQHFLARCATQSGKEVTHIAPGAAEKLLAYPWPGNVRELCNAIEHAVVLTRYDHIMVADLPERIQAHQASHLLIGSANPKELITMDEVERLYIQHVLEAAQGNKTAAARILGFDRKTLYRKLAQYGLNDHETAL